MEFAVGDVVRQGVRLREPQQRRRRDMRGVSVLLGMGRQMAVGRANRGRRALRDARDDVFEDGDGCVGDGDGGVAVVQDGREQGRGLRGQTWLPQ